MLYDRRCDNDDATFEKSVMVSYIDNYAEYIMCERSGSRGVARYSREHSCLVALRDGRCDNDDATFDSFPLLYTGGCVRVEGEAEVAACRLSSERAQLLRRAMRL